MLPSSSPVIFPSSSLRIGGPFSGLKRVCGTWRRDAPKRTVSGEELVSCSAYLREMSVLTVAALGARLWLPKREVSKLPMWREGLLAYFPLVGLGAISLPELALTLRRLRGYESYKRWGTLWNKQTSFGTSFTVFKSLELLPLRQQESSCMPNAGLSRECEELSQHKLLAAKGFFSALPRFLLFPGNRGAQ